MRDANRLYDFYNQLRYIHITYLPDWRFGQLCSNFFGWLIQNKGVDLFYPEDDQMIDYIKEYVSEMSQISIKER